MDTGGGRRPGGVSQDALNSAPLESFARRPRASELTGYVSGRVSIAPRGSLSSPPATAWSALMTRAALAGSSAMFRFSCGSVAWSYSSMAARRDGSLRSAQAGEAVAVGPHCVSHQGPTINLPGVLAERGRFPGAFGGLEHEGETRSLQVSGELQAGEARPGSGRDRRTRRGPWSASRLGPARGDDDQGDVGIELDVRVLAPGVVFPSFQPWSPQSTMTVLSRSASRSSSSSTLPSWASM